MFIEIIKHTPTWVFVLFVFLIILGYKQTKTRIINHKVSLILPVVMIGLSIQGILVNFTTPVMGIISWLAGAGISLWFLSRAKQASYENNNGLVQVVGSWAPMFVIMTIFIIKYTLGVSSALNLSFIENVKFIIVVSFFFGSLNALSISRAWLIFTAKSSTQTNENYDQISVEHA
ncbi:MAG: hypothetical protein HRT38_02470 [Alteromonadaceae bacterium]|nr:hypothetical protein [Alteromonadaceae bacterium]